ncbi:WXG100 family type VII secretion target [Micromonospora pisi]|uniref:WXG100 family type VII secretion target n=1 Tax=Micromonospora pisi TaxID=589240 RepID=A0A495JKR1_9ACTN|nr:WXG100 family type VII secretion target [Micromonospora pisi]RKR89421.1 WXG100 family type VII secretion target [Micromonospora pisi]
MTTPGFNVTPEMVHSASVSCNQTAEEIARQLSALRTYVVSLEGNWRGIAQDTFQELMNDYDVYSRMMHDALTDISLGLQGNQVNYTDAEMQNIRNLQPVDGQLMPGQPGFELPPARF